ncbi:MAG: chromosome segregation protein SMC [Myxococcota bacterium]
MRIKSLQLHGFKSFVDRTVFRFDPRVTAVVGPNGCGKSNVVDAIRWVMGEQAPTRLRGEDMGDVIFKGTEGRPAIGVAEVTLTIDNSDGGAPAPYTIYPEIQLSRRLYRSGESDYRLNNAPCRLRDIHDFFRDTGSGIKGYTIVEQGRIAEMISARPEARRGLIEEAAGISKYKARRREAEGKIASTERNLTRVNDVLGEVRRQISSLERQAQRASRFKRLQETQRILELSLAADERRDLEEVLRTEKSKLGGLRDRVEALDGQATRSDLEVEEKRIALAEFEKAAGQGAETLYRLRSEIKELEGRIELAHRETAGLEASNAGRSEELETLADQKLRAEQEAQGARSELESLDGAIAQQAKEVDDAEAQARAAEGELREVERTRDIANEALVAAMTAVARSEDRVEALDDRRDLADQKLRNVEREFEVQQSLVAEAEVERGATQRGLHGLLAERDRVQELLVGALRRHETVSETVRSAAEGLREIRETFESRRARQHSLEEFVGAQEDVSEGNRHLLSGGDEVQSRFGLNGLLRDHFQADGAVEKAVDAVLAERCQALVVDRAAGAVDALRQLRSRGAGRGVFICHPVDSVVSGGIVPMGEPLLDRVQAREGSEALVRSLLEDVYLVETLQEPVDAFGGSSLPATFVTSEGDLLTRDGVISGAADATAAGSLGRIRELRELESEVNSLTIRVREAEAAHRDAEAEWIRVGQELDNFRNRHHTAALAVANREKDLERSTERMKTLGDVQEARGADRSALFEEGTQMADERESLLVEITTLREQRTTGQREVDTIVLRAGSKARESMRLESRLAESRAALQARRESHERLGETTAHAETALRDTREWIARRERESEEANTAKARLRGEIADAEATLEIRLRDEEAARLLGEQLRGDYDTQATSVRTLEESVRQARTQLHSARAEATNADLALRESELRLRHRDEAISEKWGIELSSWRPPTLEDVGVATASEETEAPESEASDTDREAAEQAAGELRELRRNAEWARRPRKERSDELESVRHGLQSLGDVNLGAIEEHEELAERFRFLSEQKDDLDSTIQSLREAIARINRTSRKRFRETFEAVSARFTENFPRLFGGGKASLQLTEAEDILEAGVEILAMPPGKRLQNVNLLSGGEKTMTALALLVAVFQVKPSPYFFLDEVDAALDDANVGRFNELIAEMAAVSQFIIITHNKRTIEVADLLYGVTMEQKGVSKLVAVELH